MNRTTEQILVNDRISALHLEADANRLVTQARQRSKAAAKRRPERPGLSFGFLRRLVDRLVAA